MDSTLSKKIKRKLISVAQDVIPYNLKYRPHGFYATVKDYVGKYRTSGADFKVIFDNLKTELQVPKDLYPYLAKYTLYDEHHSTSEGELFEATETYQVVKVPHGRLYTNNISYIGIVSEDNKLIGEVSYQYFPDRYGKTEDNHMFRQTMFNQPEEIKGTVFSLCSGYGPTHNIAHWMFDAVPRIYLLKKAGWFDEVDYFVVPENRLEFQRYSLEMLGIPMKKVIVANEHTHITADTLIASSHPRGKRSFLIPDWITHLHREYLLPVALQEEKNFPDYVFISRKDSRLRNVTNEDELFALLQKYGFKSFELSKLSFPDKIRLFNRAKIVVSSSGAGLTSLFFCRNNAKVVEFFPRGFVHTHYFNISRHIDLDYHYLICDNDHPAQDMVKGQLEDITVDLKEMDKILKKMFAKSSLVQS